MDLEKLQQNWDQLGREDPMWAILADPTQHGNKWDREAFFATGREHVDEILAELATAGVTPEPGRALDFGCGVGRLTQALAGTFAEVDGVDIAPSMIEQANGFNPDPERIRFHLNGQPDLALFADASFDFLLSLIVLQHIENRYKAGYLREFVRVLRPGGVAVFTVPSHAAWTPRGVIYRVVPNGLLNLWRKRRYGYEGVMELHGMPRAEVEGIVRAAGGELVRVVDEPLLGTDWRSYRYTVRKP